MMKFNRRVEVYETIREESKSLTQIDISNNISMYISTKILEKLSIFEVCFEHFH